MTGSFRVAETEASLPFHSHPSVLLIIAAIVVFYWWAFTKLGPERVGAGEVVATARQKQWIAAGVIWTFVFSYWPLHDISEKYLFLSHMIQHSVFTMVAPACFLLGSPSWLWRWVLDSPIGGIVRIGSKPLLALLVFNGLIAGTHFPGIVETSLHNEWFHFLVHAILFASATLMWIPVINREPDLPVFAKPLKMIYLFAQSIVPTVPASFLTFSTEPMYPTYGRAPRLIDGLTATNDQTIAAAIMKLGVGSLLWGIVGYLFYTWWTDSKEGRGGDNKRSVAAAAPVRVAGLTVSGKRVDAIATPVAAPAEHVLTWAEVEAEFARLDAEADAAGT